jgi:3-phenylpropionate/trans-cinnamate dioxygenase ferredoxin reductase subunit
MQRTKYLVVGAGMTAAAAVEGIRSLDATGEVTLVGAETDPPYNRPPLSKALWKGGSLDEIWRSTTGPAVDLRLGRRIESLDPKGGRAVDDRGAEISWERLLLATGGRPRRLKSDRSGEVIYFRTLADYRLLREKARAGSRIAVVGGGFIGSEVAAALAQNGVKVTMVFPEDAIGARIFPAPLADFVTGYYAERGVEILRATAVSGVARRDGKLVVETSPREGGATRELAVEAVVAGIGIEPDTLLATQAGLAVDNGVLVDEHLRASAPGVFAAGDVASFPSSALGRRMRVEHEDNANTMGRLAGRNMAGAEERYSHLPFFYSDLFDLGYEAVGDTDARLQTVADWKEPFREGVVFYLQDGRVRGVLLWNVWEKVQAARRLIARPGPVRGEDLGRGALD